MKVNIFAGNENLFRVFEICAVGGHTVKLINSTDEDSALDNKQIDLLTKHLNSTPHGEIVTNDYFQADIIIELAKPDFVSIISARKNETLADIVLRVDSVDSTIQVKTDLTESSNTLLKTAYDRLNLQPYEVEIIIKVAETIAKIDGKEKLEPFHIAEAIQYRSIDKEFKK